MDARTAVSACDRGIVPGNLEVAKYPLIAVGVQAKFEVVSRDGGWTMGVNSIVLMEIDDEFVLRGEQGCTALVNPVEARAAYCRVASITACMIAQYRGLESRTSHYERNFVHSRTRTCPEYKLIVRSA